jgi:non-ribosomal peptide synthetase component F
MMIAYIARSAGQEPGWEPLPVQYPDFVLWQRDVLGDEGDPTSVMSRQVQYWRRTLAGLPQRIILPTDRSHPAAQTNRGAEVPFAVSAATRQQLQQIAVQRGVTLYMVMHAAYTTMLAALTGTDDITIGTPTAGRGEEVLDDLVGMFVNNLVLRSRVDRGATFAQLLEASRETVLGAFAHSDTPFDRLVEIVDPVRSPAWNPLFQVALSFQNLPFKGFTLPGLEVEALAADVRIAKSELHLTFVPKQGEESSELPATFTYATDLFDESTVTGFADRFLRMLDRIAADPDIAVEDLMVAGTDELMAER